MRRTTRDSEIASCVPYVPNTCALKPRVGPDFMLPWDYSVYAKPSVGIPCLGDAFQVGHLLLAQGVHGHTHPWYCTLPNTKV